MATASTSLVSASGNLSIDSLLDGNKWSTASLTYSFPVAGSTFLVNYSSSQDPWTGFSMATSSQQAGLRQVLAIWAAVANLSFSEVTEPGSSGVLRFAQSGAVAGLCKKGTISFVFRIVKNESVTFGAKKQALIIHLYEVTDYRKRLILKKSFPFRNRFSKFSEVLSAIAL